MTATYEGGLVFDERYTFDYVIQRNPVCSPCKFASVWIELDGLE